MQADMISNIRGMRMHTCSHQALLLYVGNLMFVARSYIMYTVYVYTVLKVINIVCCMLSIFDRLPCL